MISIAYTAPPTLSRFLDSDAFVRAIVGPVGSGKSSVSVLEILRRAKEQRAGEDGVRRTRFVVIRNTYPELRDTTRKTFEQWIPPALGKWNEQQFCFTMRFADVHCEVLFRALDRPEDVKKLLSLELTGAWINEAREVPKHVFDVLQSRVGRYPSKKDGGPSWFGVWCDTNPWHTGHWAYKLFSEDQPRGHELYEQPDGLSPQAENVENLPDGYYERLTNGKDAEWIAEYVRAQYPKSDKGSIYGALVESLRSRGGICEFEVVKDDVFTSWDLGGAGARGDATACWFWRLGPGRMPELVDHYENSGQPLSHYFDVLDRKGYGYARHFLPHDARAKTLVTGASVVEKFIEKYDAAHVAIAPQLSLADGIAASRWLLEQPIRIHAENCAEGVRALAAYRRAWDEANKCFSNTPVHDWSSHTADGFRYLACAFRQAELTTRPTAPPKPPDIRQLHYGFSLDELYEAQPEARRERY